MRLGAVESISEVPPIAGGAGAPAPQMMRAAKAMADGPVMDVSGGQVPLSADVYVVFAVLAP